MPCAYVPADPCVHAACCRRLAGPSSVSSSCCRREPGSPGRHEPAAAPAADPLLPILRAELQRNFDGLKSKAGPPVLRQLHGYDVRRRRSGRRSARSSAIPAAQRSAVVDVRVGDYALDNTHEIAATRRRSWASAAPRCPCPHAGRARARSARCSGARPIASSSRPPNASRVKTNVAAKVQEGAESPTCRASSRRRSRPARLAPADAAPWEQRLRRVTAPSGDSRACCGRRDALRRDHTRYFVSTEGAQIVTSDTPRRSSSMAMTKADDGMELPLYDLLRAHAGATAGEAQLVADVREMVACSPRCARRRWSIPYTGPAILSGRAAGVFFHEIFGHRIEGHRTKRSDEAQTFAKRLNQPVLPAFLSVVFDPDARARRRHRARRPLRLRRRRREGAARRRRRQRRAQDVSHEPLAGRRHPPVERPRPGDARPVAGIAPVEPRRRGQRDRAVRGADRAAEARDPQQGRPSACSSRTSRAGSRSPGA